MSRNTRSDHKDAQLRRTAVKRYRAGIPAKEVARQLHRSRSWVYKWVAYRAHHPWTRFRSVPRAPHHHPTELSVKSERRIVRLRQLLMRHRQPRLAFCFGGGTHHSQGVVSPLPGASAQFENHPARAQASPSHHPSAQALPSGLSPAPGGDLSRCGPCHRYHHALDHRR